MHVRLIVIALEDFILKLSLAWFSFLVPALLLLTRVQMQTTIYFYTFSVHSLLHLNNFLNFSSLLYNAEQPSLK